MMFFLLLFMILSKQKNIGKYKKPWLVDVHNYISWAIFKKFFQSVICKICKEIDLNMKDL